MNRVLLALFLLITTISCTNKIDDNRPVIDQFTLKLALTGDFKNNIEELATKTDDNDMIAVQVYQKSTESGDKYKPYSYGLWNNNLQGAELKINKGFLYRFEATLVENAKDLIASSLEGAMRQPFYISGTGGDSRVNNKFIYSSINYFSGLHQGTSALINGKSYNLYSRPILNRYYTNLEDVTIEQDTQVILELKRIVFGLKYNVIGLTEGKVLIELEGVPKIELNNDNHSTLQSIICFQGSSIDIGDWMRSDYQEKIQYVVHWEKANGTKIEILKSGTYFQRKMLYTMEIDLTKTTSKVTIALSKDDDKLDDGGVI